ncbi:Fatty acid desaturase family protein [Hyella patelloides LEGE 07179]|uniref:Fatty acid desaturase family protein n=1 Tax=Hyella patelloides LEGE 07179 TaxID=945734 RepID=A0A563VJ49_9CYAN|nr:fatty acid desaturase [Hyella patelloides]VEP11468.1 Fatty acid desaturase family protein [Hyella patelloides LEGE 07179]
MFVRKKIDYYPITIIVLIFALDLLVFFFSPSWLLTLFYGFISIYIKGFTCSLNHHHQHYKFFSKQWANRVIEFMMGLQTGIVGELWVLHHTLGHHQNYLDQSKDESGWKKDNGETMNVVEYTINVGSTAYARGLRVGKKYPREQKRLIQNIIVTLGAIALFAWINWYNALIVFILPMLILLYATAFDTYKHHAGLDTNDPYQATYNVIDPTYNWFTCNLGYHTAHHLQYGKHWAELPQLHEKIKDQIPQEFYREAGFPFPQITKLTTKISLLSKSWERC